MEDIPLYINRRLFNKAHTAYIQLWMH